MKNRFRMAFSNINAATLMMAGQAAFAEGTEHHDTIMQSCNPLLTQTTQDVASGQTQDLHDLFENPEFRET